MAGKWLELLREIAPDVTRVAAMFDRTNVLNAEYAEFAQTAERLAPSLAPPIYRRAGIKYRGGSRSYSFKCSRTQQRFDRNGWHGRFGKS